LKGKIEAGQLGSRKWEGGHRSRELYKKEGGETETPRIIAIEKGRRVYWLTLYHTKKGGRWPELNGRKGDAKKGKKKPAGAGRGALWTARTAI